MPYSSLIAPVIVVIVVSKLLQLAAIARAITPHVSAQPEVRRDMMSAHLKHVPNDVWEISTGFGVTCLCLALMHFDGLVVSAAAWLFTLARCSAVAASSIQWARAARRLFSLSAFCLMFLLLAALYAIIRGTFA